MTAFTIRISDELDQKLMILAKAQDRPKAYLAREAIKHYIWELTEDKKDAEIALSRRNDKSEKIFTSEQANEYLRKKHNA
jgi:predicted transcriptional regulator